MKYELKNCPCCDAKAEITTIEAYSVDSSYRAIVCTGCGLQYPLGAWEADQQDVDAWNRRVKE